MEQHGQIHNMDLPHIKFDSLTLAHSYAVDISTTMEGKRTEEA